MDRIGEPYAQREWGGRVVLDFFLGGAGSGLVAFYLVNSAVFGEGLQLGLYVAAVSLVFILGGLVLLASELGRPSNLWRSVVRFRKSWMARGAAFTSALLVALALLSVSFAAQLPFFTAAPLYFVVVVLSLAVSLYPGMLLHSIRDIKSWRSGIQPALTFVEAVASGLGLLLLVDVLSGSPLLVTAAEALLACALALVLSLAFLGSLARSSYQGARASYLRLTSADKSSFFPFALFGYVIPIGCLLPALLSPGWVGVQPAAVLGTASLLCGNVIYRLSLLLSARHEPITILGIRAGRPLGREGQDAKLAPV